MLKFIPEEVPSKRFFSQASGYTEWNLLNKDYQGRLVKSEDITERIIINY